LIKLCILSGISLRDFSVTQVANLKVILLICQAFEQELKKRKSNIDSIQKAAKDVMESSDEDTSLLQAQLIDMTAKWDKVSSLSSNKQQRLTDAYTEVHLTYIP